MTIDITTNAYIQLIQTPSLVYFSKLIAIILDPIILILTSVIISIYLYIKKFKKESIFLASTILIAGVLIKFLKEIFQRARPPNGLMNDVGFSFPSGTVTIAVIFFGLISYLFVNKKYKIATIITTIFIILLIGLTRIYIGAHWLTDVLGGFVIGGIILATSIYFYKRK